ncbi:hypothetical protein [Sphingomonas hankookensis]|uniref:Uncharacterized protein n=1 Tax=Sphingomonas hankookensis TaxID=563996 RepID=A0ABR5YES4_9SPHN|nr:hypothetical protein [Sphingomonas hankookensis]KZE16239.1 hypothetical protein AVT10_12115 [Sphingomonas hankookensis]
MACRLCTANDRDALIEFLAEKLWDSRMGEFETPTPWSEAGPTWQGKFREMAVSAALALEH